MTQTRSITNVPGQPSAAQGTAPAHVTHEIHLSSDYDDFDFPKNLGGLPEPLSDYRLTALVESIQTTNGPQAPILVDRDHVIWDGRSRFLACRKLQIPVPYIYLDDQKGGLQVALNGALQRDWSPLERAKFVHWAHHHHDLLGIEGGSGRQRDATAEWLQTKMGWRQCVSGKSIDQFVAAWKDYLAQEGDEEVLSDAKSATSLNELNQALAESTPSKWTVTESPRIKALNSVIARFTKPSTESLSSEEVRLIDQAIQALQQYKQVPAAA